MSKEKKFCPHCGKEINANAKKCRFCNTWFEEEIECPFCAEKIKASAKKCHYCGEWLSEKMNVTESNPKNNYNIKDIMIIFISLSIIGIISSFIIWKLFFYIPQCSSSKILKGLENHIKIKYPEIQNLYLSASNVNTISKEEKGCSCKINAMADQAYLTIEYSYSKASFKDYNYTSKIILPDCYDSSIKEILSDLLKKSEYLNFNKVVSDIDINYTNIEQYNKEIPSYTCNATVKLKAKPGQAFVLSYWDIENADNEISCDVSYKSLFCGNGYTTCASLNNVHNCKYKED